VKDVPPWEGLEEATFTCTLVLAAVKLAFSVVVKK